MKFHPLISMLIVLGLIATFGCTTSDSSEATAIESTPTPFVVDQEPPRFDTEDYSSLMYTAPDYLTKLGNMKTDERQKLFDELAVGKTDTLGSRFGEAGLQFFRAARRIEGYRNQDFPSAARLEALYQAWAATAGEPMERLLGLLKYWNDPVIPGFTLKYKKDLGPKTEQGRTYMGWLVTGSKWPETLEMEPSLVAPRNATKQLPKAVPVSSWKRHSDGSAEIWIDVTDIEVPKGTKIYFMSTFIDPANKARRYVKPRPELAIGGAPNVLYLEF